MESNSFNSGYKTTIEITYWNMESLSPSFPSALYHYLVMTFPKFIRLNLAKTILANDSPATNEQYY